MTWVRSNLIEDAAISDGSPALYPAVPGKPRYPTAHGFELNDGLSLAIYHNDVRNNSGWSIIANRSRERVMLSRSVALRLAKPNSRLCSLRLQHHLPQLVLPRLLLPRQLQRQLWRQPPLLRHPIHHGNANRVRQPLRLQRLDRAVAAPSAGELPGRGRLRL